NSMPEGNLAVGQWRVEFANGVTGGCAIAKGGTAPVIEAQRAARGKTPGRQSSGGIVYDEDRAERCAPGGKRVVVGHWDPGSALPTGTRVGGIAERMQ